MLKYFSHIMQYFAPKINTYLTKGIKIVTRCISAKKVIDLNKHISLLSVYDLYAKTLYKEGVDYELCENQNQKSRTETGDNKTSRTASLSYSRGNFPMNCTRIDWFAQMFNIILTNLIVWSYDEVFKKKSHTLNQYLNHTFSILHFPKRMFGCILQVLYSSHEPSHYYVYK